MVVIITCAMDPNVYEASEELNTKMVAATELALSGIIDGEAQIASPQSVASSHINLEVDSGEIQSLHFSALQRELSKSFLSGGIPVQGIQIAEKVE